MTKLLFVIPLFLLACGDTSEHESVRQPTPQSRTEPQRIQEGRTAAPNEEVERCILNSAVKGKVLWRADKKPSYLSGDFDGDGLADYAVAVRGPNTRRNGVLICTAKSEVFILGADNPLKPAFSDMPNDNFVSPDWKVLTMEEAEGIYDIRQEPPTKAASPKGDAIAMIWEDGVCLIYWDGYRYRWGCGQ